MHLEHSSVCVIEADVAFECQIVCNFIVRFLSRLRHIASLVEAKSTLLPGRFEPYSLKCPLSMICMVLCLLSSPARLIN